MILGVAEFTKIWRILQHPIFNIPRTNQSWCFFLLYYFSRYVQKLRQNCCLPNTISTSWQLPWCFKYCIKNSWNPSLEDPISCPLTNRSRRILPVIVGMPVTPFYSVVRPLITALLHTTSAQIGLPCSETFMNPQRDAIFLSYLSDPLRQCLRQKKEARERKIAGVSRLQSSLSSGTGNTYM